jgi:uncharacterized membrane protein YphA (DoxX/SURF4 family)
MKLTAETIIRDTPETVWRYTQTPDLHARWDLRFTDIEPLDSQDVHGPKRFRYATRIGFGLAIEGWGETVGDGTASALKFGSDDPKSLIVEGAGSWTYGAVDGGTHFSTVYDYKTRYGLPGIVFDSLVFRPLMIWATRWSFDRLRLWIENGTPPDVSLRIWLAKVVARVCLAFVWLWEGLLPKLICIHASEIALVGRSHLYFGDARLTLNALGIMEVLFGLWLLSGRTERLTAALSAAGTVILGGLVALLEPGSIGDPFGGIAKNLGLLGCAAAVWLLAPIAPSARQPEG